MTDKNTQPTQKTTTKTTTAKSTVAKSTAKKTTTVKTTATSRLSTMTVDELVHTRQFQTSAIVTALLLVIALCLGLIFGLSGSRTPFAYAYGNLTQVGYSAEILGTVARNKPVADERDGGLSYPGYGSTLSLTTDEKNAILAENNLLNAKATTNTGGSYDWMDENGNLYVGTRVNFTTPVGGVTQLYKHSAANGMYLGDVDDSEQAVIKRITYRPRSYNSYYNVTGLYAPAGEVIKIQISEADMNATEGITVHIGQALYNGQCNNIWAAREFNRMPVILNTMNITKDTAELKDGVYTAYVGSFLGGPIYVRSESSIFSVTISGGVNYAHFILGVTSKEDYETYSSSSAPYFDLEVWDSGVLHSGPKTYAEAFSYDDLHKAAELWEKISLVSSRVSNQGIVFLYDPFIAAGAAVAFPGRRSVNCPMNWMSSSLDYTAFVTSGAWGNVHEYHHNFQNFGVGYTGEVTNNALNLVSYSLFTKISSARQVGSYGGLGLAGWNTYTSATWALNRVNMDQIDDTNGLAVYATLLHNFGQDAFINTTGATGANYFNKWAQYTHQDFSYYASLVSSYGGDLTLTENDYPMFVPVSSVYQTGRSYMYDGEKRYIETMQPFTIHAGESYTVDLRPYTPNLAGQYDSGSIVIGKGFSYKIKNVDASGINGTFNKISDGIYEYVPGSELRSGKIYVTLEITTTDTGSHTYNGKQLDDVDLVLEFEQSHESNKDILERISYIYGEDNLPANAQEAFNGNYSGSIEKIVEDNVNVSQNSNTDAWLWEANNPSRPADAPEAVNRKPNSVVEIRGKIHVGNNGTYRVVMRGRYVSAALYVSFDNGKTYTQKAYLLKEDVIPTSSPYFSFNEQRYYFDFVKDTHSKKDDVLKGDWVYFKLVFMPIASLITQPSRGCYVGLGFAQWVMPLYSQKLDANGNPVRDAQGHIIYLDANGNEVSASVAEHATYTPPTASQIAWMSAYRQNYEFTKEFTSDYFYVRKYNYEYEDVTVFTEKYEQTYLENIGNYVPWENNGTQELSNLFDGDGSTAIHTAKANQVTPETPAIIAFDMGDTVTANTLKLYRYNTNAGVAAFPKVLLLEGSHDLKTWFKMGSWDSLSVDNANGVELPFDEANFRYWKITVSESHNEVPSSYFALSGLEISHVFRLEGTGDNMVSPDSPTFNYVGKWHTEATESNFGHVYVGKYGAKMTFQFEGRQFAILSSKDFRNKFEVHIDGKLVDSMPLKDCDGFFTPSYISPKLTDGKHTVVIKCKGKASIDSIALYR